MLTIATATTIYLSYKAVKETAPGAKNAKIGPDAASKYLTESAGNPAEVKSQEPKEAEAEP